jgi:hypothetical protein
VRPTGIMLSIAVVSFTLTGCALRDTRDDYAYSAASEGLWGDTPFELIDWNFPTSRNQGPIDAPQRIRLDRTAIGVTWATRNPLPLSDNLAPRDAPPADLVKADDGAAQSQAATGAGSGAAGNVVAPGNAVAPGSTAAARGPSAR